MSTILKKISIMAVLLLATITTVKASDSFSHTVLSLLDDPRIDASWSRVIDSQDEWESFYNEPLAYIFFAQDSEIPTASVIDFEQYQILTGGLGVQNTGGFQLVISDVEELDAEIVINVLMVRPSETCLSPETISYPSATAVVRRSEKPFSFSVSEVVDECL